MYPAFAYSRQMEIILAGITVTETLCVTIMMANILLKVLGLNASKSQKFLFAFITGTVAQNMLIYGIYIYGGMVSFSKLEYAFVVTPNPMHAIIYYFAAQKILGLSQVRSVKLMGYVFLIWLAERTLNRLIGYSFFVQNEFSYNYLKDGLQQITCFAVILIFYLLMTKHIKMKNTIWQLSDIMFFNRKREFVIFLTKSIFSYAVMLIFPVLLTDMVIAYIMIMLILILFLTVSYCVDIISFKNQTIAKQETHISTLFNGMEELRGIKHDFNNILQTYNGFLELEEYEGLKNYHASLLSATSHAGSMMELAQKMHENPAIITLLMNKLEYADKKNVKLMISLKCVLEDMYIDNMDASRVLACLLDNAIEAASTSVQRKAYLSIEAKTARSKIIIVTNSTSEHVDTNSIMVSGMSTKPGHKGIGLTIIRNILNKYGNCSFQINYFDHEVSSYIALSES